MTWPPPANTLLPPTPGFTSVPDQRMPAPPGVPATVSLQPALQVAAVPPAPPRFELTVVPATRGPSPPAPPFATHCPEVPATELRTPVPLLSTTPAPNGVTVTEPTETVSPFEAVMSPVEPRVPAIWVF